MPFVSIKCYPKDDKTKQEVVDAINGIFLEKWGCPAEAISVSLEEVDPSLWQNVEDNEIAPKGDKLMIKNGKKLY